MVLPNSSFHTGTADDLEAALPLSRPRAKESSNPSHGTTSLPLDDGATAPKSKTHPQDGGDFQITTNSIEDIQD
ncbi:hypothetical protein DU475_12685 [Rhodopseudomonas sp. WA056]|nr:hypothetical protein [Rhodopseudomonas sp. WA056]